jgi:hypothetical protein
MQQESFDKDYLRDLPADNGGWLRHCNRGQAAIVSRAAT